MGNQIWPVDIGGSTTDNATGILGLSGGDVVVFGSIDINNAYRPAAARITAQGVIKWGTKLGSLAGEVWSAAESKGDLLLACKSKGACCSWSGAKAYSCSGSTCSTWQ